jgi:hypothetical protein
MQHLLPWILASLSLALALGAAGLFMARKRARLARALPSNWALTARPVFNSSERRLYRLLREALPQHTVLAKLPLVRFCQPTDPKTVRYWFGLLGNSHVSFAICSHNGRVLAVVDVEGDKQPSSRATTVKQSVLKACGIRYLACTAQRPPTVPELQQLVPAPAATGRGAAATLDANATRRERKTLWQDSGFMQDSFFGMDGRGDRAGGPVAPSRPAQPGLSMRELPPDPDDVGGVVIDTPVSPLRH